MIESQVHPSTIPGSRTKILDRHAFPNESASSSQHDLSPTVYADLSVLSPYEADHIVQSLETFPLEEVGSSKFMYMYAYQLERLSLQAHACAQSNASDSILQEEFVVESILNFEKIPILVQTLLTVELWRIHLWNDHYDNDGVQRGEIVEDEGDPESSFLSFLADHGNTLRLSFILHTETTLVCLLTLVLFRRASCRDIDCDIAIALVDYCARQMV